MQIKSLQHISLEQIVECLLIAFEGYFVHMPTELSYWDNRFRAARVDYGLSFGVFDDDRLVAFIIQGIDIHNGEMTAFNTGTGVVPEYRGLQLVDKIYAHAIPDSSKPQYKKMHVGSDTGQ